MRRRVLGAVFAVATFASLLTGRALVPELDRELERLDALQPPTTARVLGPAGQTLDRFFLVRRMWVPVDEMAPVLLDAVVAAEDRRFYEHFGVDLLGIVRAAWSNLEAGGYREGGSTITQQVVKNTITGAERTLKRKLWEALLALRLEQRMDKRRILELYLNLIYLGSGNHGVEAAARDYLGVSSRRVDLAGAALLAGLIPSPSRFTPRAHPDRARERRRQVLDVMVELGWARELEARAASEIGLAPPARKQSRVDGAEGFMTEVRRLVRGLLGERMPFQAGLRVHTSLDLRLQKVAREAVRAAASEIDARRGLRLVDPAHVPAHCAIATVLEDGALETKKGRFELPPEIRDARVYDPKDALRTALPLRRRLKADDAVVVCPDAEGRLRPELESRVEGAAVVMEHATGRVRALVGGRAMPMEGFNRATQALRQAGSAFKPFVYATAFEQGASQLDLVLDGPLSLDAGGHELWVPQNASRGFWGPVTLRTAFTWSLNTPAVRLAMIHGSPAIIDLAGAAGIEGELRRDLTIALGTSEVHPLDLAAAIAGLVRGGVAVRPRLIDALTDQSGHGLALPGEPIRWPGSTAALPGGEGVRFAAPSSAWQVVELMRSVVARGTGRAAAHPDRDRGGKTGTTSDYRDAWFVGFDGAFVVVVWVGQDDGVSLGRGESGDRAALPAWRTIADALPPSPRLQPPASVVPIRVGSEWVSIASEARDGGQAAVELPPWPTPLPAAPPPPRVCDR